MRKKVLRAEYVVDLHILSSLPVAVRPSNSLRPPDVYKTGVELPDDQHARTTLSFSRCRDCLPLAHPPFSFTRGWFKGLLCPAGTPLELNSGGRLKAFKSARRTKAGEILAKIGGHWIVLPIFYRNRSTCKLYPPHCFGAKKLFFKRRSSFRVKHCARFYNTAVVGQISNSLRRPMI